MIGMMYLVLTALLALNVSNAVLEKFAILNTTLNELRYEEDINNFKTNQSIQEATSKSPKVQDAKTRALEVRSLTAQTIRKLDSVKELLKTDHKNIKMPDDELVLNTNIAEEKMLSSTNPKLGTDFEKVLVEYVSGLEGISPNEIP